MVFVDEFLGSIGVEREVIDRIMAMLEQGAQGLDEGKPGDVREAAFGASEKGMALAADTALARHHLVAAIEEMAAGLRGFRGNLDKWQGDLTSTDEDAGSTLTRIHADSGRVGGLNGGQR